MTSIRDVWLHANNIMRTSRQIVNEALKPLGLTSAEGNILLHLLTQPGSQCQEDIVQQLDISKPAVSRALSSLETKGFVHRKKDSADKRVSRVLLTAQAMAIGPQVEQIYNQVFALAAQGIKSEEVEEAVKFFQLVSLNFSQARERQRGTSNVE
jgi:DNA-binding MarR family transcriptional regulator